MTQPTLKPLQKYTREPAFEAQTLALLALSEPQVIRHIQNIAKGSAGYVVEETLACLLREYRRQNKRRMVDIVVGVLQQRVSGFIARRAAAWPRFTPSQRTECQENVFDAMWRSLLSEAVGDEFWEVRFWKCLNAISRNEIQKYHNAVAREQSPIVESDDESYDLLEQMPATDYLPSPDNIAIQQALAQLTAQERQAVVLRAEGLDQQNIAALLGVSDRTVRNLLQRAREKVERWQRE